MRGKKYDSPVIPDRTKRRRLNIHDGHCLLPVEIIEPCDGPTYKAGPTLLFLHEGLGSIAQWRDYPLILSLTVRLPAVVYERCGHGNAPARTVPRTERYLHEEALQSLPEVMKQMQIQDAILIGHSDGGSIALIFAAACPERVRGIITEAAHVFVEEVTLSGIREAVRLYDSTDLPQRLAKYHGCNAEAAFRAWSDVWLSPAFRDWNIEEYLPEVRCPVLAIQGKDDEYGSPLQVETIIQSVSGPRESLMVPGCGHVPHHQARKIVLNQMSRFILGLIQ
jgi:pimeloyl-ACP methyl ester carboxylesterase